MTTQNVKWINVYLHQVTTTFVCAISLPHANLNTFHTILDMYYCN